MPLCPIKLKRLSIWIDLITQLMNYITTLYKLFITLQNYICFILNRSSENMQTIPTSTVVMVVVVVFLIIQILLIENSPKMNYWNVPYSVPFRNSTAAAKSFCNALYAQSYSYSTSKQYAKDKRFVFQVPVDCGWVCYIVTVYGITLINKLLLPSTKLGYR